MGQGEPAQVEIIHDGQHDAEQRRRPPAQPARRYDSAPAPCASSRALSPRRQLIVIAERDQSIMQSRPPLFSMLPLFHPAASSAAGWRHNRRERERQSLEPLFASGAALADP
jgi:hypothetical protein